jgi:hypothetical protein
MALNYEKRPIKYQLSPMITTKAHPAITDGNARDIQTFNMVACQELVIWKTFFRKYLCFRTCRWKRVTLIHIPACILQASFSLSNLRKLRKTLQECNTRDIYTL